MATASAEHAGLINGEWIAQQICIKEESGTTLTKGVSDLTGGSNAGRQRGAPIHSAREPDKRLAGSKMWWARLLRTHLGTRDRAILRLPLLLWFPDSPRFLPFAPFFHPCCEYMYSVHLMSLLRDLDGILFISSSHERMHICDMF